MGESISSFMTVGAATSFHVMMLFAGLDTEQHKNSQVPFQLVVLVQLQRKRHTEFTLLICLLQMVMT